jgi:hypothetical protein
MEKQTLAIGDTGAQLVLTFNTNFNLTTFPSIYFIESYAEEDDPDDTLAFQRCVDDMPDSVGFQAGGGTIMLAGKTYTISDTIVIQKSINIIGVGSDSGSRIYLSANSDCNMLEIGKRNSSTPISVTLQGFRIEMNPTQAAGYSNVVCYNYIRHSHFIDLFVIYATAANWIMTHDGEYEMGRNNYFYGCAFEYGTGYSVHIGHNYNLNISNCYFGFGAAGTASFGLYISMASKHLVISNSWFLTFNLAGCITLFNIQNVHVVNNCFDGSDGCNAGSAHIRMAGCDNVNIGGNIAHAGDHHYAVRLDAGNTNVRIYDNQFLSYSLAPYYFNDKAVVKCYNNKMMSGKMQEDDQSATILNGQIYVEVSHNVFTAPDNVIATPQGNEAIWIDTITATTFRINRVGNTGNLICNWKASVKTY